MPSPIDRLTLVKAVDYVYKAGRVPIHPVTGHPVGSRKHHHEVRARAFRFTEFGDPHGLSAEDFKSTADYYHDKAKHLYSRALSRPRGSIARGTTMYHAVTAHTAADDARNAEMAHRGQIKQRKHPQGRYWVDAKTGKNIADFHPDLVALRRKEYPDGR